MPKRNLQSLTIGKTDGQMLDKVTSMRRYASQTKQLDFCKDGYIILELDRINNMDHMVISGIEEP